MTIKEFNVQLALGTLSREVLLRTAHFSRSTKLLTKLAQPSKNDKRYGHYNYDAVLLCIAANTHTPASVLRELEKHSMFSIRTEATSNLRARKLFYDRKAYNRTHQLEKEQATE